MFEYTRQKETECLFDHAPVGEVWVLSISILETRADFLAASINRNSIQHPRRRAFCIHANCLLHVLIEGATCLAYVAKPTPMIRMHVDGES